MATLRTHKAAITTRQTKKAIFAVTAPFQLIDTRMAVATGALAKEF
jgi:hypothetical protein